jgi:hypothetical protein
MMFATKRNIGILVISCWFSIGCESAIDKLDRQFKRGDGTQAVVEVSVNGTIVEQSNTPLRIKAQDGFELAGLLTPRAFVPDAWKVSARHPSLFAAHEKAAESLQLAVSAGKRNGSDRATTISTDENKIAPEVELEQTRRIAKEAEELSKMRSMDLDGPQAVIVCELSSYDWKGEMLRGGDTVGLFTGTSQDGRLGWKASPPLVSKPGRWTLSVILVWTEDRNSNHLNKYEILFRREMIFE